MHLKAPEKLISGPFYAIERYITRHYKYKTPRAVGYADMIYMDSVLAAVISLGCLILIDFQTQSGY